MSREPGVYALLFLGGVLLGLLLYFLKKPVRLFFRFFTRTALGGLLLVLFNTLGFPMGVNAVTASVVGLLGIPGVIGLYILKTFLK